LEMVLASWKCCPQLFDPHVEDDNGHVEDEHPLHPLHGMSLPTGQLKSHTDNINGIILFYTNGNQEQLGAQAIIISEGQKPPLKISDG
jgi:hypothetical protein